MSKTSVITTISFVAALTVALAFGNAAIGQTTSATPPPSGTSSSSGMTGSAGNMAKKPMPAASNPGTNSGASKLPDNGAPKSKGEGKGG